MKENKSDKNTCLAATVQIFNTRTAEKHSHCLFSHFLASTHRSLTDTRSNTHTFSLFLSHTHSLSHTRTHTSDQGWKRQGVFQTFAEEKIKTLLKVISLICSIFLRVNSKKMKKEAALSIPLSTIGGRGGGGGERLSRRPSPQSAARSASDVTAEAELLRQQTRKPIRSFLCFFPSAMV